MKKTRLLILLYLLFLLPSVVSAGEIPLPAAVNATASVVESEKYDLWEKSLIVRFPETRRALSTNDGFVEAAAVVNHAAHPLLWKKVCKLMRTEDEVGGKIYLRKTREKIARSLGAAVEQVAQMGTAADMDNLSVVTKKHKPFTVTALVTAGARTNALRTGTDEGAYVEGEKPKGTVNIIILTNAELTDGAMARAIITVTEAKTAAFQDLRVPSSYTEGLLATGTGTDSVVIVTGTGEPKVTYTGGHSRIGELIGKAVHEAVITALEKQNGFKRLPE